MTVTQSIEGNTAGRFCVPFSAGSVAPDCRKTVNILGG
jgi:hypothetical protein